MSKMRLEHRCVRFGTNSLSPPIPSWQLETSADGQGRAALRERAGRAAKIIQVEKIGIYVSEHGARVKDRGLAKLSRRS